MRRWIVFATALLVSFGMSVDAEAGKKNKGEMTEASADAAEELVIEETGIADVDAIFTKADAPLENIKGARMSIDALTANVNESMGIAADAPFKEAIASLMEKANGKLEVAMNDQGVPSVTAADAVPDNVQASIDAVNDGFANVSTAVMKLKNLPTQVQAVIDEAKSLNAESLTNSGVKPLEAPKVLKKINNNAKVLSKVTDEAKALETSLTTLKKELTAGLSS